ncbi:hypothetical protein CFR75_05525 [Komagataeibacter xylinus]|uniref:Uncharacterized protein n=3 Tax=Komagataeibacter xylinus TaxID=28448 RepID=A0A318Q444_KOMXY|nr:hypothetical protein CXP35_09965 [Komagataeibacter xylinus]PYD57500.1 hypothetical protein CFR75_05525 [Komagataeibacter xylinus]
MAAQGGLMLPRLATHPLGALVADGCGTALGLWLACVLVLGAQAIMHRAWPARCVVLRGLMLALMLPGLALALLWPGLAGQGGGMGSVAQGAFVAPAALWPLLRVLDAVPPGLSRTARGLGAGAQARLRLLWLPLLAAPVAGVGVFCAVMTVLCAMAAAALQ